MTPYPYGGGGMFGMPRQGMYSQGGMFASSAPPPTFTGQGVPQTGGPMNVPSALPPWLTQFLSMRGGMPQQPAAAPMSPPPLQSSDPNVQQYLNQNYMPGIHGGPDPSMLAGSMPTQQPAGDMNKVAQVQPAPNPFARSTGPGAPPPGTTNGPGGLQFNPPGQPTQLFGPTAGLFAGATRPQGTPNNFGYFPGTQQWGAPNMGWAPQWGQQPNSGGR